jgi:hypothetical protein
MFTDTLQKEGHIHIGTMTQDIRVENVIAAYCMDHGYSYVPHSLDFKVEGRLSEIANNAPVQNYDIHKAKNQCFQNNYQSIKSIAEDIYADLISSLGIIDGYMEAEWLIFSDYGFTKELPILPFNFFDCIVSNQKVTIDTTKQYFEFHWTVPAEFVTNNFDLFCKSGLKVIGIDKNGKLLLVITTLVRTWKDGLILAQKVDKLQFGDWKLEVKKYYSQDMFQWKFLMTTIKH